MAGLTSLGFDRTVAIAAACLIVGCAGSGQEAAGPSLPDIPTVAVETLPAPQRERLQGLLAAVRATPLDAMANGELAIALHANQQYKSAEALYGRAAALDPGALRWPYYLGVVRHAQGKYAEAAEALEAAAAVDPAYAPVQQRLADTRLALNEPREALAIYEKLLQGQPADPNANFGAGRALISQGDPDGAIARFEKAVESAPQYAAAHYELGLAYRDRGEDAVSARHLDLYNRFKQSPAPALPDPLMEAVNAVKEGAGARIARGITLEKKGDIQGAIAEHLAALEADPSLVQAHVNLVQLYGRAGDPAKAEEHYREALALAPGQADLHYNFGVLLLQNGRIAEAQKAFEQAVATNPAYAAAHNNLGQIAERSGDIDKALQHYRRALEAQPNFRLARFHLGRMLLAKRSPKEAIQHLERALEPRDEMTPHVLFGLAVARVQLGDTEGGRKLGGEALQLAQQTGQAELAQQIAKDLDTLR